MNTAITVLIILLSAILLAGLVSYICIMIAAYQIKKKAEEFMNKKGMDVLNKGIDTGINNIQNKVSKNKLG